jgi:Flp pilus assembly protein TadG
MASPEPTAHRAGARRTTLAARLGAARRDERGDAMIIWCLGLAILLLPLGGISIDLWHTISEERALQTAATDAADAGASGINTTLYHTTGQVALDPTQAVALAEQNLAQQSGLPALATPPIITVSPDEKQITVQLNTNVHLTLLSLVEGNTPIHIVASSSAAPRPSGA